MREFALINGGYTVRKNLTLGFPVPAIGLSKEAKNRLKWFDYYFQHDENATLTSRYFGISRKTFHKWLKRFNPYYLQSLEDKSKKPKKFRTSHKLYGYGALVSQIRREHPTWSKYKICAVIRQSGGKISNTSVGYILKKKGLIDKKITKKRKRAMKRNSKKIRVKNVEIHIKSPGALIQMDTKEYNPSGEDKKYQFTAIDCFSRKRKLKGYGSKTAFCGKDFLLEAIKNFPFKIKAILTDNGSEFSGEFDAECKRLGIPHYWTDPDSPDQNSYVESSHSIDEREFYQVYYIPCGVTGFNEALGQWEKEYNGIRPHGSIKFLAPDKFLKSVILN